MNNSKIIVKEIRERIKTVRIEKGYSQDYMADMLNISQNAYHKLEKGHTRIHLEKFIDIAKVLEVEVSDLFNGPDHVYIFSSYYRKKHIRRL
ncbi:MAG: transcriptional regulator [Gammaproteobacteria bacterium]|nr:transcriptional regulator [Gammaproteobacteria bacterium]MDG1509760.1 helix-turn-helix transcriptional regulator [Flavobacteriaceae bacterium]MDG2275955.1 helix-turn-helix transcriptional regulator [Flavobacteriaceae bacterium]